MKKANVRKSYMTLLEVLVAMSILSVLLVLVFGFFYELTKIDDLTRYQQSKTFQRRYIEFRLAYLFSNLINERDSHKSGRYFFSENSAYTAQFTKFPTLVFTYDNGVRLDPTFSGDLLGRLFVDHENRLCLASWPINTQIPQEDMNKEILLENVEGFQLAFFRAPMNEKMANPADPVPPSGWQDEWVIEPGKKPKKMIYPALVKIGLSVKEKTTALEKKIQEKPAEEMTFIFHLPKQASTGDAIFYSGGPYQ